MTRVLIELVRNEAQADDVRRLAASFVDWLDERYPERAADIGSYLTAQDVAGQLQRLLTIFAPPDGECLLARFDGRPAGIVMLKRRDDGGAEMNRMFVAKDARGRGLGRALCTRLIERATKLGYTEVKLSALPKHHEALRLYRSVGFTDDERVDAGTTADTVNLKLRL